MSDSTTVWEALQRLTVKEVGDTVTSFTDTLAVATIVIGAFILLYFGGRWVYWKWFS